jgi:hypothetical protein
MNFFPKVLRSYLIWQVVRDAPHFNLKLFLGFTYKVIVLGTFNTEFFLKSNFVGLRYYPKSNLGLIAIVQVCVKCV